MCFTFFLVKCPSSLWTPCHHNNFCLIIIIAILLYFFAIIQIVVGIVNSYGSKLLLFWRINPHWGSTRLESVRVSGWDRFPSVDKMQPWLIMSYFLSTIMHHFVCFCCEGEILVNIQRADDLYILRLWLWLLCTSTQWFTKQHVHHGTQCDPCPRSRLAHIRSWLQTYTIRFLICFRNNNNNNNNNNNDAVVVAVNKFATAILRDVSWGPGAWFSKNLKSKLW